MVIFVSTGYHFRKQTDLRQPGQHGAHAGDQRRGGDLWSEGLEPFRFGSAFLEKGTVKGKIPIGGFGGFLTKKRIVEGKKGLERLLVGFFVLGNLKEIDLHRRDEDGKVVLSVEGSLVSRIVCL